MALSRKSLAGPGYVILNIILVMNVISFLAVITASVVMLVKTSASTPLFFFDALGHVITMSTSMFLIASEVGLFPAYFERSWPLLSKRHGFITLSIAMIVIGITIMGNLNKAAGSQEVLGMAFWRIVIASGILIFVLGHINLIATFIFRDRKAGITARQVRANGGENYPTQIDSHGTPIANPTPMAQSYKSPSNNTNKGNAFWRFTSRGAPDSELPSYTTGSPNKEWPSAASYATRERSRSRSPDPADSPTSKYSRATDCPKKKLGGSGWGGRRKSNRTSLAPNLPIIPQHHSPVITGPLNFNKQFDGLVKPQSNGPMGSNSSTAAGGLRRPDSAMHPSRTGESDPYRWKV